jgi:hypothetical protein
MIVHLALKGGSPGMRIGELVAELITALAKKDLVQVVLDVRPNRASPNRPHRQPALEIGEAHYDTFP